MLARKCDVCGKFYEFNNIEWKKKKNKYDVYEQHNFWGISSSPFTPPEVWEDRPNVPNNADDFYLWFLGIYYIDKERKKFITNIYIVDHYYHGESICDYRYCNDNNYYTYQNGIVIGLLIATLFFILILALLFIFNII